MGNVPITATVVRVSPNPEKPISVEDQSRIRAAMDAHESTRQALRDAVLDAKGNGAGMRALQTFTGFSTNTINRWRKEREEQSD